MGFVIEAECLRCGTFGTKKDIRPYTGLCWPCSEEDEKAADTQPKCRTCGCWHGETTACD